MKLLLTNRATSVDRAIEPTPMLATPVRDRRGPISANTRKPANGKTGINHKSPSTSPSHLTGRINVQRLKPVLQLEQQRQSHRDLRRCHGQDKDEHHLTVSLSPTGSGDDEGQPRSIQHDFDGEQDENDIAPHQDTDQPERKEDPRDKQS